MQRDRKSKNRKVRPGDLVYVWTVKPPHLSPKFFGKWKGPLRVEGLAYKFGSGKVYELSYPQNNQTHNCHIVNFKIVKLKYKDDIERQIEINCSKRKERNITSNGRNIILVDPNEPEDDINSDYFPPA